MALFCPATLLIARHGDATSQDPGVMSDDGGWLTDVGKEQVSALAERLVARRVARTFASPLHRAVESAELAGRVLGGRVETLDGLEELHAGDCAGLRYGDPRVQSVLDAWVAGDLDARIPGAESGHEVVARYREALETIADQYRGETVLVFSHGGVMSFVLPRLAANVRNDLAARRFLPNAAPAEVEVGDDGWRVVSWPGTRDPATV